MSIEMADNIAQISERTKGARVFGKNRIREIGLSMRYTSSLIREVGGAKGDYTRPGGRGVQRNLWLLYHVVTICGPLAKLFLLGYQ